MNSSRDQQNEALQAALRVARENENRWMEISAEFSTDAERMEQWSSTAKLRRLEVERLEALLASAVETCSLAQPVGSETVEVKDRMGETA
jgi:gamma-glutamyl phosphate reductase